MTIDKKMHKGRVFLTGSILALITCLAIGAPAISVSKKVKNPNSRTKVAAPAKPTVLAKIEGYKAPQFPASLYVKYETYDYRQSGNTPVPPTLTDTFICDIWQRIGMDLKLKIEPKDVTKETIEQAMDIYLTKDWGTIAGYRPWTHWNFIRGLNEKQKATLAQEVVAYIKKVGIKDVE